MENTATQNKNPLVRLIEKAYGGLDMSWRNVILFAVGTAVLTAFFMIVPIFKDTSFERMGSLFESWIFFAVIIMANCYQKEDTKNGSFFDKIRQPLICAAKVFVFFLISQPLIYLFEVPFKEMGWKLFGYYPYWFKWTLATIPMAFIGWYINKKNWLSLIILSPILFVLTSDYIGALPHKACDRRFLSGAGACLPLGVYAQARAKASRLLRTAGSHNCHERNAAAF